MAACGLCGLNEELQKTTFGELGLCPSCLRGNVAQHFQKRGFRFQSEQLISARDESMVLKVDGEVPGLRGGRATVNKLTVAGRLIGALAPGAKTGDDLFDAHVRATGKPKRWLDALLSSDAVRSASLEVVTKDNGEIKILGNRLSLRAQGQHLDGNDLLELNRAAALLLRRMAEVENLWVASAEL